MKTMASNKARSKQKGAHKARDKDDQNDADGKDCPSDAEDEGNQLDEKDDHAEADACQDEAGAMDINESDVEKPSTLLCADMAAYGLRKIAAMGSLPHLDNMVYKKPAWRVGSLCSGWGTEAITGRGIEKAWDMLERELNLSVPITFCHEMMVEVMPTKRDILMEAHPNCGAFFGDVADINKDMAWCYKAGKEIPVPSNLDIVFAGAWPMDPLRCVICFI